MTIADRTLQEASRLPIVRTAVAHPCDAAAMTAAFEAFEENLLEPVLVGPIAKMRSLADEIGVDLSTVETIDAAHSHEAAAISARLAAQADVAAIMKGSLQTSELLRGILGEKTLRTERRISHLYVLETPNYPKPFMITDSGINVAPDLATKRDIAQNAADMFCALTDGERPAKIAVLAAVEKVKPEMPVTVEAAALSKMADRGQITRALVDGPLAFDNAISREAALGKGIVSEVAGDADILLVPDLEAGNMLAKQMSFIGGAESAATVLGARVPIVLPSRSDSLRTRLLSCALAVRLHDARQRGRIT